MSAKMQATIVTAASSAGIQDITISGFGTPKAAMLYICKTVTEETFTADNAFCVGVTDGTKWNCVRCYDVDNQATTVSRRAFFTDRLLSLRDAGTTYAEATFNSWITNGIKINWGTSPVAGYKIIAIFWGGSDVKAHVNNKEFNVGGEVVNCGFKPDMILGLFGSEAPGTSGSNLEVSVGLAMRVQNINKCFYYRSADGAATSAITGYISSSRFLQGGGDGSLDIYATVGSYTSSGFTVTGSSDSGQGIGILALSFGPFKAWGDLLSVPTSTGIWTVTSLGFKPQMVADFYSSVGVLDTIKTDDTAHGFGFGYMDTVAQWSFDQSSKDNAADSDTFSEYDNRWVDHHTSSQAEQVDVRYDSFISQGFKANVSATDGVAHYILAFAISDSTSLGNFWPFMTS